MRLAKPRLDIGFATNNAPASLAFWQKKLACHSTTRSQSVAVTNSTATIFADRS